MIYDSVNTPATSAMVKAWHDYLAAHAWTDLVKPHTAINSGCGLLYELGNPLNRPNEDICIADQRQLKASEPHYHPNPDIETYYILEGSTRLVVGHEEVILKAGDVYVIPPDQVHVSYPDEHCVLAASNLPAYQPESYIVTDFDPRVRLATVEDTLAIGQLLYDFNTEYNEPTPTPAHLSQRFQYLLQHETVVLLAGEAPDGIAVLRFRPSIWSDHDECYLAELYVRPTARGRKLGRALLNAAIAHAKARGADYLDLGTSADDKAARQLYESCGFTNRENGADGPIMYVYEREL